jgi:hypothetical protein
VLNAANQELEVGDLLGEGGVARFGEGDPVAGALSIYSRAASLADLAGSRASGSSETRHTKSCQRHGVDLLGAAAQRASAGLRERP